MVGLVVDFDCHHIQVFVRGAFRMDEIAPYLAFAGSVDRCLWCGAPFSRKENLVFENEDQALEGGGGCAYHVDVSTCLVANATYADLLSRFHRCWGRVRALDLRTSRDATRYRNVSTELEELACSLGEAEPGNGGLRVFLATALLDCADELARVEAWKRAKGVAATASTLVDGTTEADCQTELAKRQLGRVGRRLHAQGELVNS